MTLLNHLESLPEPYRTKALNNTRNFEGLELRKDSETYSQTTALAGAFPWVNSPEGFDYCWDFINTK